MEDEKNTDPNTVMLLFAANLFEQKYKTVAILLLIPLFTIDEIDRGSRRLWVRASGSSWTDTFHHMLHIRWQEGFPSDDHWTCSWESDENDKSGA